MVYQIFIPYSSHIFTYRARFFGYEQFRDRASGRTRQECWSSACCVTSSA
jgi:hypothetical protein